MFSRYVAIISYGCCKSRSDVTYFVIVVHVCCKLLFPMFYLFFQKYFASVFIWMLHMFHTYIASVLSGYCICFIVVFWYFCKCFRCMFQVSSVFRCMLQVLHLVISKVDWELYPSPRLLLSCLSVSSSSQRQLGIRNRGVGGPSPMPPLLDAG